MKFNKVIALAMLTCALIMTGCQSNEAPKEEPQQQEQQVDEKQDGEEADKKEDENADESAEKVDYEKLTEETKGKEVVLDEEFVSDPAKGSAKEAIEAFNKKDRPKVIVKALTGDKDNFRILEDFQDDFQKIKDAPFDFLIAIREKDLQNTEKDEALPSNMIKNVIVIPNDDGLGLGVPEKGMIIFVDKDNKVKFIKPKMSLEEMIQEAEAEVK